MNEQIQLQLLNELALESLEGLEAFDHEMLALERGEENPETWNNAFRIIHTIKGSSGCLGLGRVESVAHAGESLLSELRDGTLHADARIVSSLLRYSGALRQMMESIGQDGDAGADDHAQLVSDLQALQTGTAPRKVEDEGFGFFDPLPLAPQDAPAAASVQQNAPPPRPPASETAIRVDIAQIDRLMNLVGELVLARNQIVQYASLNPDPPLLTSVQRVNLITSELQESVMKTRMQPIGNIWSKIPRVVRDLSVELGKEVALSTEGSETELDRTIIEAIKDPLTHIIRNAIDHGIEPPAQRVAAGKPAQGRLSLRAFHEGGQVNIEIRDDGAGIDGESVLRKAVQRGVVSEEQSTRLSHREILNLIFSPGLSTAEKVTNVSGRGVGMDVVKNNIEKIGGSVDLQSERGKGATLRIRIPLTLAIIPALVVGCAGERYAIPAASLVELVRIEGDQVERLVERIQSAPVYRLRGNLLPLVHLAAELKVVSRRSPEDALFLVVLQAEGRQFGLVVDSVNDTEEIVVKPLGKELKGLSVYAGATIMGDGAVSLILDVLGIARRASLLHDGQRDLPREANGVEAAALSEPRALLVAHVGVNRIAIPLSFITRLEELPAREVERAGNTEVIQYRGHIMRLVRVGTVLGLSGGAEIGASSIDPDNDFVRLVVCELKGQHVGFVIDAVEDIVAQTVHIEHDGRSPGIIGTAVVQQFVTDLLDIEEIARMAA